MAIQTDPSCRPSLGERTWTLAWAFVQGLALLLLHETAHHLTRPDAEFAWFWPLYTLALLLPVTAQLLAPFRAAAQLWRLMAGIGITLGAVAAYSGWQVLVVGQTGNYWSGDAFAFGARLASCWLILLPFAQQWLRAHRWRPVYGAWFADLWNNNTRLASAGAFTGGFWLALLLAAGLFDMLGLKGFGKLIGSHYFSYPATAMAFGLGLSVFQIKDAIYRGLFGALGWLLPLVAAIEVVFLAALPFTGLSPLWNTGHATALMLCLQIAVLALFNATWQDGLGKPPLTAWLRPAVALALAALPMLAALCAYAIQLRVGQYGWSVDRVWAALATGAVGFFVVGYAVVAIRREADWMAGAAKVNVAGTLTTAALLLTSTTPLLDPARIATASQIQRLLEGTVTVDRFDFNYLRIHAGRNGYHSLDRLASLSGQGQQAEIRNRAQKALAQSLDDERRQTFTADTLAARLKTYPAESRLEDGFLHALAGEVNDKPYQYQCLWERGSLCPVLVVDLNGDAVPEHLLVGSNAFGSVFEKSGGTWNVSGQLSMRPSRYAASDGWPNAAEIQAALDAGTFRAVDTPWRDLEIGRWRFSVH